MGAPRDSVGAIGKETPMSEATDHTRTGVNSVLAERIERLREKFEAEWLIAAKGGQQPSLELFLANTPEPDRPLIAEALSVIDRVYRSRMSVSPDASIADDMLPTMLGSPDGNDQPTVSPTVQVPIDRHAPSMGATLADQLRTQHGSPEPTIAPTIAATRAGMSITDGMAATVAMDASGITVEHHVAEAAPAPKARGKREIPKVDGYEILGELGRGGMGVVYKARDKKLDRLVALKMVIAGAHASQDQLDRFELEAQAVARLQHPDIVQVYAIGQHDGLPYFSLEFVEGGTLAHKIAGKPQLPKYAAEIALILAGAMHVAHKKHIIHRDLKPANILLTAEGLPKITDFGLAKKLEDDSQQTRSGAIMGTPSYMAPEQAWGETGNIGPLADQYALGAILYELLTGRPPFQGATPLDTLDQVRSQEPVPPTRLQPKIAKDLETICLKALQKDPRKRYADCEELASDLQRYLDGKSIQARPVPAIVKGWRWCKRNQKVAALLAAVVLLLVSVTVVASFAAWSISKANVEIAAKKKAADDAATREHQERVKAQAAEAKAIANKKVADEKRAEAEEQNLIAVNALTQIGGLVNHTLQSHRDMQELRLKVEKAVVDEMDKVKPTSDNTNRDSLIRWHRLRAGAHQQLGYIYREMGKIDEQIHHTRIAEKFIEEMAAADPEDVSFQVLVAKINNSVGDLLMFDQGNTELARPHYERALHIRKEVLRQFPTDDSSKVDVANNLGLLAMVCVRLGDPQGALKYLLEESELRSKLSAEFVANDLEVQRELSGHYEKLAEVMTKLNDPLKAQEYYDKSFEIRAKIVNDPKNKGHVEAKMDLANALNNYGTYHLLELADPKTARNYYDRALELNETLHKENPRNVNITKNLAVTYYYTATAALRMGEKTIANELYKKCLDLRRPLASDPDAKAAQIDLIVALARCGFHDEASRLTDDVLKIPPQDNNIYYQAACGYALCAGAVAQDKPKDQWSEDERKLADVYTVKAVEALQHGIEHGWRDLSSAQTDPDLDALRQDSRFESLLVKLKDAASTPAK